MANTAPSDLTRPLYAYVPEYLHTWLDEIKAYTDLTKSDIVNLLLEYGRKNLDKDDFVTMYNNFLLLGEQGL